MHVLRRHLLLAFLACCCAFGPAAAQVVTTDPAFPTVDGPVTIFFDATAGDAGLRGFTGTVYAHTGVITNESTSPTDWRYVRYAWPQEGSDVTLERVGTDRYKLVIADIRGFYAAPNATPGSGAAPWDNLADEQIRQLAFVFRNGDGTRTGKATGGSDIYVDLFDGGVNVRFAAPAVTALNPLLVETATDVAVMAVAGTSGAALSSLRLEVDGAEVAQTTDDTLRYTLSLTAPGRVDVRAIAEDATAARDTAAFYAVYLAPTADAPRPAGLPDGITYDAADPTRATLSLFAPGKDHVFVLGDFNDWEVNPAYRLRRDVTNADSVHFWLPLDGLTPGAETAFQYLVDGALRVADPYCEKVLKQGEDAEIIAKGLYPNLKAYPTGRTEFPVCVLETAQQPFAFSPFEAPPQGELVIYELLVRDFLEADALGGRTFYQALTDTLGYLQTLGVNAVELMPVAEFDGNKSWGYNPSFHFAVDKYYGPADDLKRFVEAAHQRGIAVILDVVYNHATGDAPIIRLWNEGDYGAPTADNPYANSSARHPFNVFNDLNHESTATKYWLDRANRYWLETFNVDGFRFDLSKGFMQSGDFNGPNAGRIALLQRMADGIWEVDPEAYVILEHFAANAEELALSTYRTGEGRPGMLLWTNVNHAFNEATMGYHSGSGSNTRAAYYGSGGRNFALPNSIAYMESHDEQWLMFKNRTFGNSAAGYNVRDLPVALDRQKLAGAFFFTLPGPKMVWQFGELGYGYGDAGEQCLRNDGSSDCPAIAPGRTSEKPIRWDYYQDPLRRKLYDTWSALLQLRADHAVFRSTDTQVAQSVNGALKTITLQHPDLNVVVVGNFDVQARDWSPAFPSEGTWYEFFSGETRDSAQDDIVLLRPGGLRLYTSADVGTAAPGLITVATEDGPAEVPTQVTLAPNYPNPFNPVTTLGFALPAPGPVRLEVVDALGRRVALLVDGVRPAGAQTVTFDAAGLPSGMYFYRLQTTAGVLTRPMTLLK